jgi:NADH:ubiquinone oxidoreductase subunit F (NADH-binding)
MTRLRLLAGPDLSLGAESLHAHVQRLGPSPVTGRSFIETIARAGLRGRGGASFPVARKWSAVAAAGADAVVIANGAEGEPQSLKDQVLMTTRPHLILDGALIAARTLKASQVVLYVGEHHRAAWATMSRALTERPEPELRRARLLAAPARYVAGESSAAVNLVNTSVAAPTSKPPSPHAAGADGLPTLVQNVETLAGVALLARYGVDWYRSAGRRGAAGTLLLTAAGAVRSGGVLEVEAGTTVAEAIEMAGGVTGSPRAVLLGGYFGSWIEAGSAFELPLDAAALAPRGLGLGCGVLGVLHDAACGVCETARIMAYLAGESSAQCGPCFFGLRALSDACSRIAARGTNPDDLARLHRWSSEVTGRGACRHPDGAVMFLQSAMRTFGSEFANHPAHWRAQPAPVAVRTA